MSQDFPGALKIVTVWGLIGVGLFLAFGAWQRYQQRVEMSVVTSGPALLAVARARDGHYHLRGTLNGQNVEFLVDTGASMTSIPPDLARRAGLRASGRMQFGTANGTVEAEVALADLNLADTFRFDNLRVAILPSIGGAALLGMDVLGKLKLTQEAGELKLSASPR